MEDSIFKINAEYLWRVELSVLMLCNDAGWHCQDQG